MVTIHLNKQELKVIKASLIQFKIYLEGDEAIGEIGNYGVNIIQLERKDIFQKINKYLSK